MRTDSRGACRDDRGVRELTLGVRAGMAAWPAAPCRSCTALSPCTAA